MGEGDSGEPINDAQQVLLQRAKEVIRGVCPEEENAAVLLLVYATKQLTKQDISGFIPHATYPELENHLKAVEEKMQLPDIK
jgi:hypothetical protein